MSSLSFCLENRNYCVPPRPTKQLRSVWLQHTNRASHYHNRTQCSCAKQATQNVVYTSLYKCEAETNALINETLKFILKAGINNARLQQGSRTKQQRRQWMKKVIFGWCPLMKQKVKQQKRVKMILDKITIATTRKTSYIIKFTNSQNHCLCLQRLRVSEWLWRTTLCSGFLSSTCIRAVLNKEQEKPAI